MEHELHQHHPRKQSVKRQALISLSILTVLFTATTLAILYGKGYRLSFQQGEAPQLSKTGILHATSTPVGTQIYINDELITATNNTINLSPGTYTVKMTKDGYTTWQKNIPIEKEVVANADAVLFPKAPTLQSISTFGVDSVTIDPSGTKLAFKISSQSATKNGIYVLDMTNRTFPVLAGQSSSTQIVTDLTDTFSQAQLMWAPDGKQILASTSAELTGATYYLLQTDELNKTPQNVTYSIETILNTWKIQRADKSEALITSLKPAVQQFAKKHFTILSWAPDEKKILYQASTSGQMPIFRKPRLIGNNLLYEQRNLEKGAIYVYNPKEDINTRIITDMKELCTNITLNCSIPFTWFPDSSHLIYVHDKKIDIIEDDGANMTTIYAGPFIDNYVYPWPDGSKLVILTNLNNLSVSPTLYTIGLK